MLRSNRIPESRLEQKIGTSFNFNSNCPKWCLWTHLWSISLPHTSGLTWK